MENYGKLDYSKLWALLDKKGLKKEYLHKNGVHSNTLAKLVRGDSVTTTELCKICYILNTDIKNIVEYKRPDQIEGTTEK